MGGSCGRGEALGSPSEQVCLEGRKGDRGVQERGRKGSITPRLPHPPDPFPFSCRLLPQPFLPASPLLSLLCLLLSVPAAVPGVEAAVAARGGPAHSPLPLLPSAVYHSGLLRPTGRRHLGPASPSHHSASPLGSLRRTN